MKKNRLFSIIDIVLFIVIAVGYFLPYYNGSNLNMIKTIGESHMMIGFAFLLVGLIGCIFNKKEIGYLTCGYFIGIHIYFYLSMHSNPNMRLSINQIGIGAYVQLLSAFLAFVVTFISSFGNKGVAVATQGVKNNTQFKTTVNNGQMNMPVNSFQNLPVEQKEKEKTMPKPDLLAGTKVDNSSMFVNPNLLEPEENLNGDMINKDEMSLFKQVNMLSTQNNTNQPIPMNSLGPTPTLNIPTSMPTQMSGVPGAPAQTEGPQAMPTNMMGGAMMANPVQESNIAPVPQVSGAPAQVDGTQGMPANLMGGGTVMAPQEAPALAPVPEAPASVEGPQSMPTDLMGGGAVVAPPTDAPTLAPVPEASAPVEGPQSMPTDLMGGGTVMTPPQEAPAMAPVPAVPEAPAPVEGPQSMPMDLMGGGAVMAPPQEAPAIPPVPPIPPVPQVPEQVPPVAPPNGLGGLPTPSKEGGQDISNIMNQGPSMEEQIKMFNEQQAMANNSNIPKPDLLAGSNLSGILGSDT